MIFDDNGNLFPYKDIETDINSFKSEFVDKIPLSVSRKIIFEDFIEYNHQLKTVIKSEIQQWINGSFVTQKRNPNDIDVVSFIDFDIFEENKLFFENLRKRRLDNSKFVDGYFIKKYPKSHENYKFFEFDCQEWAFLFSNVKHSKNTKGFLKIII